MLQKVSKTLISRYFSLPLVIEMYGRPCFFHYHPYIYIVLPYFLITIAPCLHPVHFKRYPFFYVVLNLLSITCPAKVYITEMQIIVVVKPKNFYCVNEISRRYVLKIQKNALSSKVYS